MPSRFGPAVAGLTHRYSSRTENGARIGDQIAEHRLMPMMSDRERKLQALRMMEIEAELQDQDIAGLRIVGDDSNDLAVAEDALLAQQV